MKALPYLSLGSFFFGFTPWSALLALYEIPSNKVIASAPRPLPRNSTTARGTRTSCKSGPPCLLITIVQAGRSRTFTNQAGRPIQAAQTVRTTSNANATAGNRPDTVQKVSWSIMPISTLAQAFHPYPSGRGIPNVRGVWGPWRKDPEAAPKSVYPLHLYSIKILPCFLSAPCVSRTGHLQAAQLLIPTRC